jgi:hypothetical protein
MAGSGAGRRLDLDEVTDFRTSLHDEGIARQERAATAIYRAALVPIAERLVQFGDLRPGIHAADAVDLLWFYFGYSSYFTLHDDNGWSYERAEHWLAGQAIAALLSPPGHAGQQQSPWTEACRS